MTYNEIIQKAGKKIKKHVYYINNGVTTNVSDESVERIKFDTQTPLVGTSINGCEITLKEPINGEIYVTVDATYRNETKSETFGPYNLKEEPTYDANKKTYLHKCYDNLLKSMVDYQPITMTYPCTVYQFFARLCTEIGYTNNILSLPNGSRQIASDIYNNIGFTYRDVLDDIAYANGVLFYIDGNEIKISTLGGDTITIDDDILKNKNIDFGKHYGPINSIVLSRSGESDNVYLQDETSVEQNGLCEFKIIDNQLMRENNREEYLQALLNQLDGIEYDIYDTELTGYGKLKPLQSVEFETGNNSYSSYIFNNEITITTGYKQAIYNDPPKETETDYKSADTTDKRINQAYIIVRKNEAEIESYVNSNIKTSDLKEGQGSIQLENAYEGELHRLSIKGNISLLFPQSSFVYGYPLVPHDELVPSNNLTPSSPVPYGNEIHYPSENLFTRDAVLIIDETEYKLDFDFLNYMTPNLYDEFVYEDGKSYIIRRTGIDSQGNMYALDEEVIEPRKDISLPIKSNSTITLKSFPNATLSCLYLTQNAITNKFATEVEVETLRLQTASSITDLARAKVGGDEIIAKLNIAIQDGQGVINLTGNQVTIDSDNFTLDRYGNMVANSGTFAGTVNTNKNLTVGDNAYIGQNQTSTSDAQKYLYFANDAYIRRWLFPNNGSYMQINSGYQLNLVCGSTYIYMFNDNYITMSTQPTIGSDKRLKRGIKDVDVSWIDKLKVKEYEYKSAENKKHIGLIAQDYIDEDYSKYFVSQDKNGYYSISYGDINNGLIKYCQEMKKTIQKQQETIEELIKRVEKLERESDK